jgi:hypothetical protein
VLQDSQLSGLERDLDAVELWSGVASIVAAARKQGKQAEPFDKNRVPGVTTYSEDICSGLPYNDAEHGNQA